MDYNQKRVKKFMEMFGQETPETPTQIDEKTAKLRASLILEETIELITKGLGLSINIVQPNEKGDGTDWVEIKDEEFVNYQIDFVKNKEVDLEQVGDGVGDVMVVTVGTSIACGIDQEPINEEILNSNDSKMWNREDLDKVPSNCIIEDINSDLCRVKRSDGKVIKSVSYQPAQIAPIIESQKNKFDISVNTLKMLERSLIELKKGNVSSPINEE